MQHIEVREVAGRWAIVGLPRGEVLLSYDTEAEARAECVPGHMLTAAQRERRFGDVTYASRKIGTREAELVQRLDAGLPLSKCDTREARRLKRAAATSPTCIKKDTL